MEKVKKATFTESMEYLTPVLRELDRLAVPYVIDSEKTRIIIRIPKFITIRKLT